MKLIGFRSNKMWKKIVACIGYFLMTLIFIVSLTEDTVGDVVILNLQYLSFGLPIILAFANLDFLKRKLPLLNEIKLMPRVLGGFIWSFVVIFIATIIFFITIATTENFYSLEKQARMEQIRVENLAKEEANKEAIAKQERYSLEKRKLEEKKKKEEENKKLDQERIAKEKKQKELEEKKKLEQEKKLAEEKRLAEQKKLEEEKRLEEERLASEASQSNTNTAVNTENNVTEMVWVTATGSKYHSHDNCGNSKTARQVSLEDAQRRGLAACKTCY